MAEIEVLGGGIFGLSVAYAVARRGAKVRLVDCRRIGTGASGGLTGALSPHTPDNWNDKKQFQFESLIAGADYWQEVERLSGLPSGYMQTGRLVPVNNARELDLANERVASAAEHWRGKADWQVVRADHFPGWGPQSTTGYLVHDTLTARIDPRRAIACLAAAIRASGGEIIEGGTARGADQTVICTGYEGLLDLSREFGCEVGKGVKGQSLLLQHDARDMPQIFSDGVFLIPHQDGTLAIGSTSENEWVDPASTDDKLEILYQKAMQVMPSLKSANLLCRWAGVRPRGQKRAPILGRHPSRPGVFIANGGFKIGFGVAIGVGEAMADLVVDGKNQIPKAFSVEANLT